MTAPRATCLDDLEAYALIGGTLPSERLAATVEHVETCDDCRELIEGLCAAGSTDAPADDARGDGARIGEIAGGTYRFDAVVADGGMGRVYRATDLTLGRQVAIEIPRSRARCLVRRFEREIAITARLAHPGIVAVHAAGALADGTQYLAMQLVAGSSLDVAVARASGRAQRLALVPHLLAVADAMAFAHERGIIHRDLKPHNVVIGRFGETVILDWGLAKDLAAPGGGAPALPAEPARPRDRAGPVATRPLSRDVSRVLASRTTRPGDVLGTPAFMAPEQARGETVDRRCDVYALGAMLQYLLIGRLRGRAAAAALDQAPAELAAICRRATAEVRELRQRDAGELAAELRAALALRRASATIRPPRRWRWRWPMFAGLAVLAIAGAGLAVSRLGWI